MYCEYMARTSHKLTIGQLKMSKSDNKKMTKLPQDGKTGQMDIFRALVSPYNDASSLSNLIDLYDQIPKYFISAKQQARWRDDGVMEARKARVELDNDIYDIQLSPALVEEVFVDDKGNKVSEYKPYFPGETEEIIEEILRKLLIDQNLGIHRTDPTDRTWVKFSIRMVREELKRVGKTRSNAQVRKALFILSNTIATIKKNGRRIHSGTLLSDWIDRPNEDIRVDDQDSLSAVQFPNMVSRAISALEFRQYDYLSTIKLKSQLARWIMRRISIRFRNAGWDAPAYKIRQSEIEELSLLLSSIKDSRSKRRKVRDAIDQLIKSGNLFKGKGDNQPNETKIYGADGKSVDDIIYYLYPNKRFIDHMKAANKRQGAITK